MSLICHANAASCNAKQCSARGNCVGAAQTACMHIAGPHDQSVYVLYLHCRGIKAEQ